MILEKLIVLLLFAALLVWLIGFILLLLIKISVKFKKTAKRAKAPPVIYEQTSLINSDKHLNDGRIDERTFEVKDAENDRPVIDWDNRQYYQNLGDKLKQDEAAEMLSKELDENTTKKMSFKDTKIAEQVRQKQVDKELHNKRMLDKLKEYRIKRKIAKKAAKKNIQLDDEMIEKIKLKALAGKMR